MTILYTPTTLSAPTMLFAWKGTIFRAVSHSPVWWFFMIFHAVMIALSKADLYDFYEHKVNYATVNGVTALLVFLVVFYGSQCYSRFQMFFRAVIGLIGTSQNWMSLIVSAPLTDDLDVRWNCARFFIAAKHVMFYSINEDKGLKSPISEAEWNTIHERQLLDPAERQLVAAYPGFKPILLLTWALQEVEKAVPEDRKDARATSLIAQFRQQAYTFRGNCGTIANELKQPVPFPYYHALHVLIVIDLFIISYAIVSNMEEVLQSGEDKWSTPALVSYFTFGIYNTAFVGIKTVGAWMADPFGDEDTDFDLDPILTATYTNALAMLKDTRSALGSDIPIAVTNPLRGSAPAAKPSVKTEPSENSKLLEDKV